MGESPGRMVAVAHRKVDCFLCTAGYINRSLYTMDILAAFNRVLLDFMAIYISVQNVISKSNQDKFLWYHCCRFLIM